MPNYYFGGVNAAGKSTFLNRLQEMPGDWEIVHGSQALMDWLGITPGDYESLRQMPRERTYHAYGELVLDRIARKREPTSLIFDSHYLNLVGGLISRTVE